MKTFRRAMGFYRADAPQLVGVLALLLIGVGLNLLKPWPVAIIVDGLLGDQGLPNWLPGAGAGAHPRADGLLAPPLLALIGGIFLLHALHGLVSAAHNYQAIRIGLEGLRRARNEVFGCLQRLSMRFHHGRPAGDLIYRAVWDTYSVQTLFQQGIVTFTTALAGLLLMVAVMAALNLRLTLVALGMMPLMALAIHFFGRRMREQGLAAQQADSAVTAMIQQGLATLPLVRSYAQEERQREIFVAQTAAARQSRLTQHGWELLYWLGVTVVFGLGLSATVWLGSGEVVKGRLTVGELWIFLAYLAQLYEPLNQLTHVGSTVSTAGAAASRVFELLDTPEEVRELPDARPVVREGGVVAGAVKPAPLVIKGAIEFEDVSFAYEAERPVLRQVRLRVRAGEKIALIGPSGAGKSTLLNLLPRFFDPTEGVIKLDGEDLRALRLRDLRSHIAVVLQEPILLPASLADNLAYGKPGATRGEIEAAAKAAQAHEFIVKLPRQYDTMAGDGGVQLSVGERQRISLARAFLKNAPILLLDEPTSALDPENEAAVMQSLRDLMRGRTVLMIAHRSATLRLMDRILVLLDGRVAQCGALAELAADQSGYYARHFLGANPSFDGVPMTEGGSPSPKANC